MKKKKFMSAPKIKKRLSIFMALVIVVCQVLNIVPTMQASAMDITGDFPFITESGDGKKW